MWTSQGDKSLFFKVPDFNHPSRIYACEVRNEEQMICEASISRAARCCWVSTHPKIRAHLGPLSSQLQLSKTQLNIQARCGSTWFCAQNQKFFYFLDSIFALQICLHLDIQTILQVLLSWTSITKDMFTCSSIKLQLQTARHYNIWKRKYSKAQVVW